MSPWRFPPAATIACRGYQPEPSTRSNWLGCSPAAPRHPRHPAGRRWWWRPRPARPVRRSTLGDTGAGQHAGCRGAVLPGVEVPAVAIPSAAAAMSASSTITGALPPSSRWVRFRLAPALVATTSPGRHRSGDRHHLRGRVGDEGRAGRAVAADDVEHTRGKCRAAISASITVLTGVVSPGLSTTVLPRRDGGAEPPDRHHHRVVPRRDLADDPDRFATDPRGVVLHVYGGLASSTRAAPAKNRI